MFEAISWAGAVLTVAAGAFVGWHTAAALSQRAGREPESPGVGFRQLLVIVGVFVLLGAYLDDGPIIEPWWWQLLILLGAPALLAFVARNTRRRAAPRA
jgi:NhaP-type Na+/H+ or K+/H+ antiporter